MGGIRADWSRSGSIYEANVISQAHGALGVDSNATWVVARENSFLSLHDYGLSTNAGTICESNTIGMLPQSIVTASTVPIKIRFDSAIAEYGNYMQSSNEIYAWTTNGSGTLTLQFTNAGSNPAPALQAPAGSTISVSGSNIIWANLAPNFYPVDLTCIGPNGANDRLFCLVAGPSEDFENAISILSNGLSGPALSYTFTGLCGQYATRVESMSAAGVPSTHSISWDKYTTARPRS